MVLVCVVSYARRGVLSDRRVLTRTVGPMSVGTIVDNLVGELLVGNRTRRAAQGRPGDDPQRVGRV